MGQLDPSVHQTSPRRLIQVARRQTLYAGDQPVS